MNRYQEMMAALPVPEGQAERLKAAVLAAEPKKRTIYRPKSNLPCLQVSRRLL